MRFLGKWLLCACAQAALLCAPSFACEAAPVPLEGGGVFDPDFYAKAYPDVALAFGGSETMLYVHYLLYGKAEGRLPAALAGGAPVSSDSAGAQGAGATGTPERGDPSRPRGAFGQPTDTKAGKLAEYINLARFDYGDHGNAKMVEYLWDDELAAAAEKRVQELTISFSHERPGNKGHASTIVPEKFRGSTGEIVLRGITDPGYLYQYWIARDNDKDGKPLIHKDGNTDKLYSYHYHYMGVGYIEEGGYWAIIFAE